MNPDILILDEILVVGDMAFQRKCFDRINNFRKAGKTILFVSHSLQDIVQHCDRAILLERGSILADGPAASVAEVYKGLMAPQMTAAR